jgi:hypothetical protein
MAASAMPAAAQAAVTLGDTGGDLTCAQPVTLLQTAAAASSPSYAIPWANAVVTSWSYQAGTSDDQVFLGVYVPGFAPGTYRLEGRSETEAVAANSGLNTFKTRIPSQAGEVLGITELGSGSACEHAGDPADSVAAAPPPAATAIDGSTEPVTVVTGLRMNAAAVVEPDLDGDGYGDETQDGCPGDPFTWDQPCRSDLSIALTAPATSPIGTEVPLQIAVTNGGTSIATGVTVSFVPPPTVNYVSGHSDSHCSGDNSLVTCNVGTIPYHGTLPTYIALMPTQQGPFTSTVSVTSANHDPNPANNSVSAVTTVGPPPPDPNAPPAFAGLKIADSQVLSPDAKRVVSVRASCPAPATTRCTGTLTLKSAGKVPFPRKKGSKRRPPSRVLTLGSGKFSILLGKSGTVRVTISTTAVAILRSQLSLDVVGTAVAKDAAGHAKTTSNALIVTPPAPAAKHKKKRKKKH